MNLISEPNNFVCKRAVANAFGKAANTYDVHAQFQRDVIDRLIDKMPKDLTGMRILDVGCGTGYGAQRLLEKGAHVVCVDISQPMLDKAKKKLGSDRVCYVRCDAEALPFDAESFDAVFSSMALQWCADLTTPMAEIRRVLTHCGCGYFSTLTEGSLFELRAAWAQIDQHQHVNYFIEPNTVKLALAQAGINSHQLDLDQIVVWYDTASNLMKDLKGIGATHVSQRKNGLFSRDTLQCVEDAYQSYRNSAGQIPATYQVCFGVFNQ